MGVTVIDILTYAGSDKDIGINYFLLVLTSVPVILLVSSLRPPVAWVYVSWVPLLAFLWAFQILLCLAVGCVGISIIWSALVGFQCVAEPALSPFSVLPARLLRATTCASLSLSAAAWVYYAVTQDAITTAAHVCAAVLGTLLAAAHVWLTRPRLQYDKVDPRTTREGLLV